MVVHSMSLNNRVSFVVGISIFGFNKYWHTVLKFMDINMSPTLKRFFQAKTFNADKKSYYQQYYEK